MNIIYNYIFKQLLKGLLGALFIIGFLGWFASSISYLSFITKKGLSLFQFLKFTTLLLPNVIYNIMPIALFAVYLFIYNKLKSERELIVMQSAGINYKNLIKPAYKLNFIIIFVCYVFGMLFIPYQNKKFSQMQLKLQNDISHLMLKEGMFNNVSKGLVIYIKDTNANVLNSVYIYDNRDKTKENTLFAEKGQLIKTQKGLSIALLNGGMQNKNLSDNTNTFSKFQSYTIDLALKKDKEEDGLHVRDLYFWQLFSGEKNETPKQKNKRIALINEKLLYPIQCFLFMLIALIGVLKTNFNREGNSKTVFIFVLIAIITQTIFATISNIISKVPFFIYIYYIILIIPSIFTHYYLTKEKFNT